MNRKKMLKWLNFLLPIPFIVGVIGYLQLYPGDLSDGMYTVLRLYTFECDADELNIFLDFARWTAPAMTTAYFLTGIQGVFYWISCQWKKKFRSNTVIAVYGDNEKTDTLISVLPNDTQVIEGNHFQPFHKVKRHVIMFEKQEENLEFFQKYLDSFADNDQIFLHLENFSPNLIQETRLEIHPFSLAKNAAHAFLIQESQNLCQRVFEKKKIHIVLIGSGSYAEELLDYWLNFNIFHIHQEVVYHIFGDFTRYRGIHYGLPSIETDAYHELTLYPKDKIRFYKQLWETQLHTVEDTDLVVLCEEKDMDNLLLADKIISYFPADRINHNLHLRLGSDNLFSTALQEKHVFSVFGTYENICSASLILRENVVSGAKEQMNEYAQLTQQVMNESPNWNELEAHVRDSNLYSSTYRATTFTDVPKELENHNIQNRLEFMAELEHIRWNRFHFLRNWKHTTEKLEKTLQRSRRVHTDLIHYDDLSEGIKDYDRKEAEKVLAAYDNAKKK